jgi:hypothetical protein
MIRSCERIIVRDDELYIYYCGVHGPHTGPKFQNVARKHRVAIGLVTQQRDGFVSLDAGNEEGYVWIKPFVLPKDDLHLSVDASDGEVRVDVMDEGGNGRLLRSQLITGDRLAIPVRWEDAGLNDITGRAVRLRLSARNAKLYSYWFE